MGKEYREILKLRLQMRKVEVLILRSTNCPLSPIKPAESIPGSGVMVFLVSCAQLASQKHPRCHGAKYGIPKCLL